MSEEFTEHELKEFVANRIWRGIVESALSKVLMESEENDKLDPMEAPAKIARNQGSISALKWVVDLPKVILEGFKEIEEIEDE